MATQQEIIDFLNEPPPEGSFGAAMLKIAPEVEKYFQQRGSCEDLNLPDSPVSMMEIPKFSDDETQAEPASTPYGRGKVKAVLVPYRDLVPVMTGKAVIVGLPEDANATNCFHDAFRGGMILVVSSESYPPVPDGSELDVVMAELSGSFPEPGSDEALAPLGFRNIKNPFDDPSFMEIPK